MKRIFKPILALVALFSVLVIGLLFAHPAYSQVVPADQLIFNTGVDLSEPYTNPFVLESDIMVAPQNQPGNLKHTIFHSKIKRLNASAMTLKPRGGFQIVEIVRLIKFRKISNGSLNKTPV